MDVDALAGDVLHCYLFNDLCKQTGTGEKGAEESRDAHGAQGSAYLHLEAGLAFGDAVCDLTPSPQVSKTLHGEGRGTVAVT